jgi:hypothetical protein
MPAAWCHIIASMPRVAARARRRRARTRDTLFTELADNLG